MFNEKNYRNPFEALDWRWTRATYLVDGEDKPGRTEDKYLWRGFKFLRDLRDTNSAVEHYGLTLKHKTAAEAFDWYNRPGRRRCFIEALSLCDDLTIEQEAEYLGVRPDVVKTYEKLFFDVRDKRYNKGFLCTHVLQPAIIHELYNANEPVYAWKLCAIFGGFKVVKSCWEYCEHPDEVNEFHKRAGISQLFKNFGLGNYFRQTTRYSIGEISDSVVKILELEVRKAAIAGMSNEIKQRADIMSEIMTMHKFTMVEPDEDNRLIDNAREPRFHERLKSVEAVTVGGDHAQQS